MSSDMSSVKKILNSKYTAIAILLIISIGVYLNALPNEFVYDDRLQVLNNPWIKDIRYIPDIILTDVWAFEGEGLPSNYYRPLMHIIYMIDYHIFGLKPWGFHLINILFHAGVSVLVFLIFFMLINQPQISNSKSQIPKSKIKNPESKIINLKSQIQNPKSNILNLKSEILNPPFIAALLFAAHPIHTEAVTWIGGIPELSFTLLYLLSFYFYINSNKKWGKRVILSVLFFFLATLCKETALTLPLLIFVYDYSFRKDTLPAKAGQASSPFSSKTFYHLLKRYFPYLIVSIIYFVLRTYALGEVAPIPKKHTYLSNYEYFINVFPLFTQYLETLLLPINLNVFHVFHPISSILQLKGIIALILTSGFVFLVYIFRKHKVVFLSLLWIVIPLFPVFYISALGVNTAFAERYLYLPSVGFVVLVSLTIERIYSLKILKHGANFVIISILIILTGLYSVGTIKRNYIWKDDYSLWTDTVKKSPDSSMAHNNLGSVYFDKKLFDKAIEHCHIALKLEPTYYLPHYILGNVFTMQGKLDEAIKEYLTTLILNPEDAKSHNNLGNVYARQERFEEAITEYMIAIKPNPDYAEAHNNIGNIYAMQGKLDEAIKEYLIVLKLTPEDAETHNNIANAYIEKGEIDKAIEHYEIAMKFNPNYVEAHYSLGHAYLEKGLRQKAKEEFEVVLKLRPDFTPAREALKSVSNTP